MVHFIHKILHILLHVKVICHTCCDTAPFFNSVWSCCQKWRQVWSSCHLKVATRRGTWFHFKVSDHFCHAILSTRPQASISFRENSLLFLSYVCWTLKKDNSMIPQSLWFDKYLMFVNMKSVNVIKVLWYICWFSVHQNCSNVV